MIRNADGEFLPQHVDAGEREAVAEHADDQRADQRADDRAAPAEQAGAADHHGGDGIEVRGIAGLRADRADAPDQRPAGDARRSGRRCRRPTAAACRCGCRRASRLPDRRRSRRRGGRTTVQLRMYQNNATSPSIRSEPMVTRAMPMANAVPVNCRNGACACEVLGADALAARIPEIEREEDAPGAERHDERRQAQLVTSRPLISAAQGAGHEPAGEGERDGQADHDRELAHHDRAQHHDRADRKIDAGGQHDQGLRDADDADDRDLLQHQREIERVQELRSGDEREQDDRRAPARWPGSRSDGHAGNAAARRSGVSASSSNDATLWSARLATCSKSAVALAVPGPDGDSAGLMSHP